MATHEEALAMFQTSDRYNGWFHRHRKQPFVALIGNPNCEVYTAEDINPYVRPALLMIKEIKGSIPICVVYGELSLTEPFLHYTTRAGRSIFCLKWKPEVEQFSVYYVEDKFNKRRQRSNGSCCVQ